MKEGEVPKAASGKDRGGNSAEQSFFCTNRLSGTDVLCDKGGHGLHVGGRHQHDEDTEFFRDSDACGGDDAHAVHDRDDHEEGDADQEILECDRTSEF